MPDIIYPVLIIAVTSLCTLLTRAAPFVIFGGKREMPEALRRLTAVLPPAIIAVLVVYCLKGLTTAGAVEIISTAAALISVVILHLWKENTLLSIAAGTIIYMALIRLL